MPNGASNPQLKRTQTIIVLLFTMLTWGHDPVDLGPAPTRANTLAR